MTIALDELVSKSEDMQNAEILYDVKDLHTVPNCNRNRTFRLPSMFRFIRKFNRAAVLSDKKWIQKRSELEGASSPGLEIKAFDRRLKEEAEAKFSTEQ